MASVVRIGTKRRRRGDILAQAGDGFSLGTDEFALRRYEVAAAFYQLSLYGQDTALDGFHGLKQSIEDWFLQRPEVERFVIVRLKKEIIKERFIPHQKQS